MCGLIFYRCFLNVQPLLVGLDILLEARYIFGRGFDFHALVSGEDLLVEEVG